jgi:hypothetical protein
VASEDPLNADAETYKKLVKFFEEHPLVQYAFTEALSVSGTLSVGFSDKQDCIFIRLYFHSSERADHDTWQKTDC